MVNHFVKKNSVAKTKRSKYVSSDQRNYFTQCLECHQEYELLKRFVFATEFFLTKWFGVNPDRVPHVSQWFFTVSLLN